MPFTDPTDNVQALLTEQAREELARSILGEVSFQLTSFSVGRGGYDPSNPVKITSIDITDTTLLDPVPDGTDRRDFITIEQPVGTNVTSPVCRLTTDDTDIEYGLGEIGIWATYLMDTVTPGNVGTDFLFAIAHFPMVCKTPTNTLIWRVMIAL